MPAKIPPIPDYSTVKRMTVKEAEGAWGLVNSGWKPGKEGKGLINAGKLYTWNTTDDDGWPHHEDVLQLLELAGVPVDASIYSQTIPIIEADGTYESDLEIVKTISAQEPRMKHDEDGGWKFGSVKESKNLLNWDEGYEGKGILSDKHTLHTWVDDGTTHFEYMEEHPETGNALEYLYIKPDGGCSSYRGIPEAFADLIHEIDPRLYVKDDESWLF